MSNNNNNNNKRKLSDDEMRQRLDTLLDKKAKITFEEIRELVDAIEKKAPERAPAATDILDNDVLEQIISYLAGEHKNGVALAPLICKRFASLYSGIEDDRFRSLFGKNEDRIRAAILVHILNQGWFTRLEFTLTVTFADWFHPDPDETISMEYIISVAKRESGFAINQKEGEDDDERNFLTFNDGFVEPLGFGRYLSELEIYNFFVAVLTPGHKYEYDSTTGNSTGAHYATGKQSIALSLESDFHFLFGVLSEECRDDYRRTLNNEGIEGISTLLAKDPQEDPIRALFQNSVAQRLEDMSEDSENKATINDFLGAEGGDFWISEDSFQSCNMSELPKKQLEIIMKICKNPSFKISW
jgi:hypothetical protein